MKRLILLAVCVSICAPIAFAQPQVEESHRYNTENELLRKLPPPDGMTREEKPSYESAPDSDGDEDLGMQLLLKKKPKYKPFKVFGDVSGFYTSNAQLSKHDTKDDYFWITQVGASYMPKILPNLMGEVTVNQQFFRYDEFKNLDFDSFNAGGGLTYIANELWDVAFFGRYNFNRLTHAHKSADGPENSEFYSTHNITAGLQKVFPINRAQYCYVGHMSQINMSNPVAPQKNDYSLFTGYSLKATRDVNFQFMYRAAYVCYANEIREDVSQTLFAGLSYNPYEWATISLSSSLGLNNSNNPANDYEVVNTGLGLNLKYKF